MKTKMTPYDIHIGEWVFADVGGTPTPVRIGSINDNKVTAADRTGGACLSFSYDALSPIPVDETTVDWFDWTAMKGMSLHLNKQTGEFFVRYINESHMLQKWFKKNGRILVHELQQFYYGKKHAPLEITIIKD